MVLVPVVVPVIKWCLLTAVNPVGRKHVCTQKRRSYSDFYVGRCLPGIPVSKKPPEALLAAPSSGLSHLPRCATLPHEVREYQKISDCCSAVGGLQASGVLRLCAAVRGLRRLLSCRLDVDVSLWVQTTPGPPRIVVGRWRQQKNTKTAAVEMRRCSSRASWF